jgi:hypothetical protein
MPALLVDRDRRGRKASVRKGPHRNGDVLFVTFLDVEDRRPALRAESERESSAFVSHPNELRAMALDGHGFASKVRLRAKDAAGSALASVTMADGDTDRFSEDLCPELTATARCKPNCHRNSYGLTCGA